MIMRGSFFLRCTIMMMGLSCLMLQVAWASAAEGTAYSVARAAEGEEHEAHIHPDRAILFPWFANIIGIISFFLLARYLHVFPYTASMFCLGTCMGVGYARLDGTTQLHQSFELWNNIDGNVLLLTFLPGLLFKDSFCSNVHLMALAFTQCLVMAFPMVLAGTCLTALVAWGIFPYSWSWNLAMTLGSILSATDPVAVSTLLEEVGAPPRLKVHVSGESLLNDGSAMVFYTIFSELWLYELNIGLGDDIDGGEGTKIFFRMALGGFAIGVAFGLALCVILHMLNRTLNHEENVVQIVATITVAYLTFYVAEPVSHCSGVIAVVFCGFTTKAFGFDLINDTHMMDSFWVLVEHILNSVLFTLGGFVWGSVIANADERSGFWTGTDWGYLFLLYVLLTVIRFFLFFAFYPINAYLGLGTNWQETFFQSYGGLRGAVGIALAIVLDDKIFTSTEDESIRSTVTKIFGMVGGIAFLTLIFNGTLAGPILKKLGLAEDTMLRHRIVERYEKNYDIKLLDYFVGLLMNPVYQKANFAIVQYHIPLFADVTEEQFHDAIARNEKETPLDIYEKPKISNVLDHFNATSSGEGGEGASEVVQPNEEETAAPSATMPTTSIASNADEQSQLAIEFRKIFVELLRSAYTKLKENGELSGREGFATYALMEGLDFTDDAVQRGEPLRDWELTMKICKSWTGPADRFVTKTIRGFFSCWSTKSKRQQFLQDVKQVNPKDEKVANEVTMAAGLIRAHQLAEKMFREEVASMDTTAGMILEESQAQMKMAVDVVSSQDDLEVVVSRLVSIIIYNKAARYVKHLCENGLLKEGEASEFVDEIQHGILAVQACPEGADTVAKKEE